LKIARANSLAFAALTAWVLFLGALAWAAPSGGEMPLVRLAFGQHQVLAQAPVNQAQRIKGLGGRQDLEPGQGMLFIFAGPAVGMCMRDMRFPLDFIWLYQGKVCQIDPNVPAWGERVSVQAKVPAQMVLEVPSGWAQEHAVYVGQEVGLRLVGGKLPQDLERVIGAGR
jgi:uncharacterized membrane protein (UPF0127 family)